MSRLALTKQTIRLLAASSLTILLLLFAYQPIVASDPVSVVVTNARDTTFTVSWLTTDAEAGQVQLAGGAIHNDDRGADFQGRTHYVTITGVQANRSHPFDVICGSIKYDNGGSHWSVTTGVTLEPWSSDWMTGRVMNPDGSNATDVIVFFSMDRFQLWDQSALLSALVTASDNGFYRVNFGEARAVSDPSKRFVYPSGSDHYLNNSLTIQAFGEGGTALITLDPADPRLRAREPDQMLIFKLSP